jgi:hypothetical protein
MSVTPAGPTSFFSAYKLLKGIKLLHSVAIKPNKGPGLMSYEDFSRLMGLGPPHNNRLLNMFLLAIVYECQKRQWPDYAALVVHRDFSGPGKGWYDAHGFMVGDLPKWKVHMNDCWKRSPQITI